LKVDNLHLQGDSGSTSVSVFRKMFHIFATPLGLQESDNFTDELEMKSA
jgi:hypothetical protein